MRNGGEECDPNDIPDIPIEGQPLSQTSVAYYFTYGSDLAVFGDCAEALIVFDEVEAGFSTDETIMSIINDGRDVCTAASASNTTSVTPLDTTATVPGDATSTAQSTAQP